MIKDILTKYENFYLGGSGYTFKIEVDDFNELVNHISLLEKTLSAMNEGMREMLKERTELEKEIKEHCETKGLLGRQVFALSKLVDKQYEEIENLRQYKKVLMENSVVRSETIEKYEKALRFYANKENYELWNEAEKANLTEFVNNLDMDKGETARKALGE